MIRACVPPGRQARRVGPLAAACGLALLALPTLGAQGLPPETLRALRSAAVPPQALSVVVHDVTSGRSVLQWQERQPVNPASLTKLLTTMAALERLGPAWHWTTPVWLAGPVKDGVLEGSLHIKGSGDPQLVLERLWLLLRRVQQLGVREIRGDIVLDNSAFAVPDVPPEEFDGEPLRPYNVRPAALLFNYRSVHYRFVPDAAAGVAHVTADPPLAGTAFDARVPLAPGGCGDWRTVLKASFEPGSARFAGRYADSCGERVWAVADPQPASYERRLLQALWAEMGGVLRGVVRDGPAPAHLAPAFEYRSPALAEVVRDINKYSNNVMAQQLFLTLALQAPGAATVVTPDDARQTLARWLAERTGALGEDTVIDNGSGLSRATRISAQRLARLLQQAYDSPVMSELMSSFPVSGLDGTLRRSRAAPGRAHLKTGSLRDVTALAGYVLTHSGRRLVLVAIVNHPNAPAARPALDALVQWSLRDTPQHAGDTERAP